MKIPTNGILLRISVGEENQVHGIPLYEAIVKKAHELNLAGASVFRGHMGFGAGSRIHTSKILRRSEDLPMLIEIVDSEEKINQLLPFLDEHVKEGLITMENVKVIQYRHKLK